MPVIQKGVCLPLCVTSTKQGGWPVFACLCSGSYFQYSRRGSWNTALCKQNTTKWFLYPIHYIEKEKHFWRLFACLHVSCSLIGSCSVVPFSGTSPTLFQDLVSFGILSPSLAGFHLKPPWPGYKTPRKYIFLNLVRCNLTIVQNSPEKFRTWLKKPSCSWLHN